ncbi:24-hydroxycholesterol 7-alpha-hydroxylase-like [Pecten maximus]|uniref:24-hydroxycholesterol 7-alpha-hydroxylase-like n=1 Tax=Pecten maximus TaxID=6579 RepID=UPI001458E4EF|nr:24-hydroxycholesterol 7-alpha-hydroxylase-like [Pecten maximus]XP_033741243.1 24-hydroxycholesterol 7-alpha-hydroxylase-like [Pecten maximus]
MDAQSLVSFSPPSMLLTGIIVILLYTIYRFSKPRYQSNFPPLRQGWVPWIGCAFEFGVEPLAFIDKMRRKMGAIYTLYVAGERLTFLTDADDFHHFFQSANVDFQKAVQDPVQNIASVSEKSFFQFHTKIHDMVKGRLASSRLMYFHDDLCHEFDKEINAVLSVKGPCNLHEVVRKSMYIAVINNLFGQGVLPTTDQAKFKDLEKNFVLFDELFEYGARLPSFMIRDWSSSKWWLIGMFKDLYKGIKNKERTENETILQTLLHLVDDKHAPNYALLFLWASLANAVPITFWCLVFILSDQKVLSELKAEISSTLGPPGKGHTRITEKQIREMPYLRWCVLEAIRLRPVGIITRRVVKSFKIKEVVIPEGDMLMLSPYWAHRNPRYFSACEEFKPDRWKDADLEKNLFLDGFVAFGGGRYQCPGRWYAQMEIQMYVALFLHKVDCTVLSDHIPSPSTKHLVGTQQPAEPFLVELTSK